MLEVLTLMPNRATVCVRVCLVCPTSGPITKHISELVRQSASNFGEGFSCLQVVTRNARSRWSENVKTMSTTAVLSGIG